MIQIWQSPFIFFQNIAEILLFWFQPFYHFLSGVKSNLATESGKPEPYNSENSVLKRLKRINDSTSHGVDPYMDG